MNLELGKRYIIRPDESEVRHVSNDIRSRLGAIIEITEIEYGEVFYYDVISAPENMVHIAKDNRFFWPHSDVVKYLKPAPDHTKFEIGLRYILWYHPEGREIQLINKNEMFLQYVYMDSPIVYAISVEDAMKKLSR